MPDWIELLKQNAAAYAQIAIENIGREFPYGIHHVMIEPGDAPHRPRDSSPVFGGSFDWHSCVEMYWLLVRLLRVAADQIPTEEISAVLDREFDPVALAAEAAFIGGPAGRGERPYGWGWALQLVHDVSELAAATDQTLDPRPARWSSALTVLGDAVTENYLGWLPKATYPVRYGMHQNSAFGLARALPYAFDRSQAGDGRLAAAISESASHWFGADRDYPAAWEPSGSDFLSPAMAEAELMTQLLPAEQFADWLTGFLPGIEARKDRPLYFETLPSRSDRRSDRAFAWAEREPGLVLAADRRQPP